MATINFDDYLDNKLKTDLNFRREYEAMLPELEPKKQPV